MPTAASGSRRAWGEAAAAVLLPLAAQGLPGEAGRWVAGAIAAAAPLVAAAMCLGTARRSGPGPGRAWLLLGMAFAAGSLMAVAGALLGGALPGSFWFPAVAALAVGGLLALPLERLPSRSPARVALDGMLIVASLLFLALAAGALPGARPAVPGWCAALGPACPPALQGASALGPLTGLLLAAVAFLTASRAPRLDRGVLAPLLAGLLATAVAGIGLQATRLPPGSAALLEASQAAGALLVALAARRGGTPWDPRAAGPTPPWLVLAPYAPVACGAAVAAALQLHDGALEPALFWLAFAAVVLALLRQSVTVLANQRLRQEAEGNYAHLRDAQAFRSRVLHTLAHDLRNPLTPVLMQLHLLEGGRAGLPPSAAPHLAVIRRNLEQVVRLTDDLADVARLQDGRLGLRPAPLDLRTVVADVAASFRPLAAQKGVSLREETPHALPVVADPIRVRQVLANLVANAVKFTPSGHILLRGRGGDRSVHVEVHDTGRGLAPEEAARLFQPFSQVHDPAETAERGTGLGLYISRALAEAHGGGLEVASAGRGRGATFTLRLPAAPAPPVNG